MIALSPHIQRTVPLATGLLCIALAGLIWMPLAQDGDASGPVTAATPAPTGPNAQEVLAKGAEELLARPLFHMTRRPPVVAAPVQAAPVAVTLSLTGIVNDENDRIALMRLSNQPDLLRRRVGEKIGNWEIEDISATAVIVISTDGARQTITLAQSQP